MEKLDKLQIINNVVFSPSLIYDPRQIVKTGIYQFWFSARYLKGKDVPLLTSGTVLNGGSNVWVSLGDNVNITDSNFQFFISGKDKYVRINSRRDIQIGVFGNIIIYGIKFRASSLDFTNGAVHLFGQVNSSTPISIANGVIGVSSNNTFIFVCNSKDTQGNNETFDTGIVFKPNIWYSINVQFSYSSGIVQGYINGIYKSFNMFQVNASKQSANVRVLNSRSLTSADVNKGATNLDIKEMFKFGITVSIARLNYINNYLSLL